MDVNIKLFVVFTFIKGTFCKEVLTVPCNHDDLECFKTMAITIFTATSAGAPEYNMEPIDPYEIKRMDTELASGVEMQFENIKITGLKNQKLEDFQVNTHTKSVQYRIRAEVDIAADVSMKLNESPEPVSGNYNAKATAKEVVRYNYSLNIGSDGIEHFTIGPETINCEPVGVPEVTLVLHRSNTVVKDPDTVSRRADYLKKAEENKQKLVCKIITEAYKHVIEQIRSLLNVLPKTAIFKDL